MIFRTNIKFPSDDNLTLRGWFYTPHPHKASPCIIMTHGFSALKEHYLDKFAEEFAKQGFAVLVYDNRNFGDSEGEPRLEVDPAGQIKDMKNAISFVQQLPEVDANRIGIWGTSFSGGVVLTVAALDKRVKCVVAQVPFISGHHKSLRLNRPEKWQELTQKYHEDRLDRLAGKPPRHIPVVDKQNGNQAIIRIPSAYSFFTSVEKWENKVTLRSVENSGEFEPIAHIKYISPTPLLFIVANKDTVNTTDVALNAFAKAPEPKKLVMIPGDHFAPYVDEFDKCFTAANEWFKEHLHVLNYENQNSMRSKL